MSVKYYVTVDKTYIRSDYTVDPSSNTAAILGVETKNAILVLASTTKYKDNYYKLNAPYLTKTAYVAVADVDKYTEEDSSDADEKIISEVSMHGKAAMDTLIYSTDSHFTTNGNDASTGNILKKGEVVNIIEQSTNGFYNIGPYTTKYAKENNKQTRWVAMAVINKCNADGKVTQKVDKTTVEYVAEKNDANTLQYYKDALKTNDDTILDPDTYKSISGVDPDMYSAAAAKKLLVKSMNGIHGAPYQFMANVDRRHSSSGTIGHKYAERIVAKMPLLLMTPGAPDFLPTFSKKESGVILSALVNTVDTATKGNLNKILQTSGRYYTFKFQYDEYYGYVNSMLRMCAVYLGIADQVHSNAFGSKSSYTEKLGSYKWQYGVNKELKGFINAQEFVAFYLDSETSISESFSTSTTSSDLMEAVNDMSKTAKELQFLAGPIAGLKVDALQADDFDATMKDIRNISNKYLNNNRLFNNLAEQFATVGKGGKIAFPEIWDDTDFSKSYDISIKLRTPDCDKLSWYLNICVPLIHLLGMAAPRQLGPNGYRSPFLVRAFYKGIFNCDMGIITNMSITKGRDSAWSVDGLPTEVDVSISLKDLYSLLTITNTDKTPVKNFLNNTCLMDYLANTCGVNINKAEIERTLETYVLLTENKVQDLYGKQWLKLQNGLSNLSATAYKKFAGMTN